MMMNINELDGRNYRVGFLSDNSISISFCPTSVSTSPVGRCAKDSADRLDLIVQKICYLSRWRFLRIDRMNKTFFFTQLQCKRRKNWNLFNANHESAREKIDATEHIDWGQIYIYIWQKWTFSKVFRNNCVLYVHVRFPCSRGSVICYFD